MSGSPRLGSPASPLPVSLLTSSTSRTFSTSAKLIRDVRDSDCYVDTGAAAALAWNLRGGVAGLFAIGALSVREVGEDDADEYGPDSLALPHPASVTFLLSTPVHSALPLIRRTLRSSSYTNCTIFTPLSEELHRRALEIEQQVDTDDQSEEFHSLASFPAVEDLVRGWMRDCITGTVGESQLFAEIAVAPLSFCSLTPSLFISAPASAAWPSLDEDWTAPFSSTRRNLSLAAAHLSSVLDTLNVQDHLFALGDAARHVAREIAATSKDAPRRRSEKGASVVIVDRTLDLVAPSAHSDHPLDLAFSLLPPTPTLDVSLPTSSIYPHLPKSLDSLGVALGLSHGADGEALQAWEGVATQGQREGLMGLRKQLAAMSVPGVEKPAKMLGKATPAHLNKLVSSISAHLPSVALHQPLLSLAVASSLSLAHPDVRRRDELSATEKVVALSAAEGASPVRQAAEYIRTEVERHKRKGDWGWDRVEEVVGLMVYAWGLGSTTAVGRWDDGGATREVEMAIAKDALVRAAVEARGAARNPRSTVQAVPVQEEASQEEDAGFDANWSWGDEEGGNDKGRKSPVAGTPAAKLDFAQLEEDRQICEIWAEQGLRNLEAASKARSGLTRYKTQPTSSSPTPTPLLARLIADILSTSYKPTTTATDYTSKLLATARATATAGETEEGGLTHISYGIANYINNMGVGGISRFLASNISTRGRTTPSPLSNLHPAGSYPTVIVFVLGGVTFSEVQAFSEAAKAAGRVDVEVVLGSTDVATGKGVLDHVFGSLPM